MKSKKDIMISFITGFIPSGGTWLIIEPHTPFVGFVIKVLATIVIGAIGGFAGIMGKDIYKYLKSNFIIKKRKQ